VCPDQDFIGLWFGYGHIETLQYIRWARLAELYELHGFGPPIYRPIERRPIPASQHLQYLVASEHPRRIPKEDLKEQELAFGKIEQCTIDLPDLAFGGVQDANRR
jgi:hypothetical protein